MLVFDLQWLLFALGVGIFVAIGLGLWFERWLRRRRNGSGLPIDLELQAVLDRAPLGLLILVELRRCRYANPYARRLLGLDASSCRLPDADWVHLLDEDRVAAHKEMAATGRYRSISLGADRAVRWWVTASRDIDLVFLLDTTASQRSEDAARFLLSDLSHELRTPLATLLTHLQVLRLPHIPDSTRDQSIQLMQQEANRMTRLVHNLLELGRLETGTDVERRPVELRSLTEGVIAQVRSQAEERQIGLTLEADTPLPFAIGDADRLRQVLINLLDNACKYSRPGDRITVSLKHDPLRGDLVCEIRDTGPGIPAEHLPHLTERFYRAASEQVGGSGLGLALAQEILRHHQSRLEISSRCEGTETGTTVRFTLPALLELEPIP